MKLSNELYISIRGVSIRRGASLNEVVVVLNVGIVAMQVPKMLKKTSYAAVGSSYSYENPVAQCSTHRSRHLPKIRHVHIFHTVFVNHSCLCTTCRSYIGGHHSFQDKNNSAHHGGRIFSIRALTVNGPLAGQMPTFDMNIIYFGEC